MNNQKNYSINRVRVSLQNKIEQLLKNKSDSHQVKFVFKDNTSSLQELTPAFLAGKRPQEIIDDLKSIQHDLGAKFFSL
jgi:hypothetical protein